MSDLQTDYTEVLQDSLVKTMPHSEIRRSDSLGNLLKALTKAQLDFGAVTKDAENPFYSKGERKSKYATLDSVVKATRNSLAKNGLVVIAVPHEMVDDRRLKITSVLFHESEQFIESTMVMTAVDRVTPQELGKLITYARRYQLSALTGVAPEDDDDGNSASGATGSREQAHAVAEEKIQALKAKKAEKGSQDAPAFVPGLSYVQLPSGAFEITGSDGQKKLHKDLLSKFWSPAAKAIIVPEQQLDDLKYMLEQRNCTLSMLKPMES